MPRVLAAAVQSYVTQVATLTGNATTFGEHLIDQIQQADPGDISDRVMDQLTQARQDINELLKQLDKCIDQAQERRKSAIRPQDDWGGPAADQPQARSCEDHQEQTEEALAGAM